MTHETVRELAVKLSRGGKREEIKQMLEKLGKEYYYLTKLKSRKIYLGNTDITIEEISEYMGL